MRIIILLQNWDIPLKLENIINTAIQKIPDDIPNGINNSITKQMYAGVYCNVI